ncbi:uncharacterized protein LOC130642176 [Hydractinia symbiolongicarpus]|uniref:uncharacterized protein LOC130642176 n=1 Tax=Hydractinia symbiolongicarpus TaxID=13093 RepID=UPI002549F633|nr:uncharacterized protein LOC130642176 [Hydractinia symbiolongicarpus]
MPSEKEKCLYYQDGQQQFMIPFVIYADFESLLIPMKENARDTKTKTLNKHVPCGWATYSTFAYGEVSDPLAVYRGEDCVKKFVDHLEHEIKRLYSTYPQQNMISLTEDIGCIAENTEKYISFNVKIKVPIAGMGYGDGEFYKKIEIRFINSCRFMSSSLEKLASNLDDEQCKNLRRYFTKDDTFKLMRCKGIYPYSYMNTWKRFEETELPSKDSFYSNLNMNGISDHDYEHAQKFRNFRGVCQNQYKFDPAHFYSAPGLAWKAALKYTGVRLELLTDPDMLLLFERGIRGGITQAVHRYAKANNKYMGDQYDPDNESSYLQYLDTNNLYGWAVRQNLPTNGFKWISNVEVIDEKKIDKLVADNNHGYLLEVDINYPKSLHDKHNQLPFLLERRMIHRVEKLIPNLESKQKYVVHIGALHQALKHGLELKKVHRAIHFQHSAWLREYIDHNTKLRTAAKKEFEKDFYKLMNLSVFGKTMENIRNHRNIKLVTNEAAYTKLTMQPNFKSGISFSEYLMGIEMGRTGIKMNKPIYIDFYHDIADDVETRFDTSAYDNNDNRPLPIGKTRRSLGYSRMSSVKSLTKDGGDRKAKGVKRAVTKKCITFEDYQRCLKEGIDINKTWRCIQNKGHNIYTQEVNKIALNAADDNRVVQVD